MKVAYITTFDVLEAPPHEGGVVWSKRNFHLIQHVFGKENVYLCCITKHKDSMINATDNTKVFFSDRSKKQILINSLSGRLQFSKSIEDEVVKHVLQLKCNIVCLDMSRMGYLQERLPKEIKQVLFLCGIERDYIKALTRINPSRIVLKRAINTNESLSVKYSDIVIALNQRDSNGLLKYYSRRPDFILPITIDDSYIENEIDDANIKPSKLQLLFVGALFPPNEHGLSWFVKEVMPNVNADLTVIGKDFEKIKDKLQSKNVNVIGTVDKLTQYYHNANAVVSPILLGEGMKVKTANHLMYGKPMFATNEALEGYDVDGCKNIVRCNTAVEFETAINKHTKKRPYSFVDNDIRTLFLSKYHSPCYVPMIRDLLNFN